MYIVNFTMSDHCNLLTWSKMKKIVIQKIFRDNKVYNVKRRFRKYILN